MEIIDLIEKLNSVNAESQDTKEDIRFLYKNRKKKHIPYWYLLKLKAYCSIFEIDYDFDIEIPTMLGDVSIYYAITFSEIQSIVGKNNVDVWDNALLTSDESFVKSASSYYKYRGQTPKFAVMFKTKLAFVDEERFKKAMSIAKERIDVDLNEPQEQDETDTDNDLSS